MHILNIHPARIPKNPLYGKQSLTITGFGSSMFEQSINGLKRLHTAATSMLPRGLHVQAWQEAEYAGYTSLSLSNRYFTIASHARGDGLCEFDANVDPKGILRSVILSSAHPSKGRATKVVHTEDNVVSYYKRLLRVPNEIET